MVCESARRSLTCPRWSAQQLYRGDARQGAQGILKRAGVMLSVGTHALFHAMPIQAAGPALRSGESSSGPWFTASGAADSGNPVGAPLCAPACSHNHGHRWRRLHRPGSCVLFSGNRTPGSACSRCCRKSWLARRRNLGRHAFKSWDGKGIEFHLSAKVLRIRRPPTSPRRRASSAALMLTTIRIPLAVLVARWPWIGGSWIFTGA